MRDRADSGFDSDRRAAGGRNRNGITAKGEIRPGDVITCPPGKKHWHGATPTTPMTHIAIQASLNGKNVEWLEQVTDQQYLGDATGPS